MHNITDQNITITIVFAHYFLGDSVTEISIFYSPEQHRKGPFLEGTDKIMAEETQKIDELDRLNMLY